VDVATVIPCYREQIDRVRRTVESAAAVGRVIVVDDGCNDETLDLLHDEFACMAENAVTVIHLPENGGCSRALNAGIETLSDDAVICRLDVGDVFYPEAKARQIAIVTSGHARCSSSPHFDPVENKTWVLDPHWRQRIYRDSKFTGCTNVYRKDVWREVGGHDESLRYIADWDFSMKVEHYIGWHMHDEATCEAGMYPDGHSARAAQDPVTKQRRLDDQSVVSGRGRALSHPDAYAHLYNEKWCRAHGIKPLRRRP
jgi:glycosyltransferase involved in cell wall biosynthesis